MTINFNDQRVLYDKMAHLRKIWEDTSFHLERYQTAPWCVAQEEVGLATRGSPPYKLTFDPNSLKTKPVSLVGDIPGDYDFLCHQIKIIIFLSVIDLWYNVKEAFPKLLSYEKKGLMEIEKWQLHSIWQGLKFGTLQ